MAELAYGCVNEKLCVAVTCIVETQLPLETHHKTIKGLLAQT
jgi:hypothetical protein